MRPIQYHFDNKFFNITSSTNKLFNKLQLSKWYSTRLVDSQYTRLLASPMLSDFVGHLDNFIMGKNPKKFILFSGHDDNIITVLISLLSEEFIRIRINAGDQFYNFLQPGFASHFIMEVYSYKKYQKDFFKFLSEDALIEDYFIRVVYNGMVLRKGFNKELIYNHQLDGITFGNFRNFLLSRINYDYRYLDCSRTKLNESDFIRSIAVKNV